MPVKALDPRNWTYPFLGIIKLNTKLVGLVMIINAKPKGIQHCREGCQKVEICKGDKGVAGRG